MQKSESIGKLMEALSKAQKEIKGAIKDCKNPFFKSSYADLSSVWDACRAQLTNNNLAVTQTADITDGGIVLETTLAHSSGEWISGRLPVNPAKNDPQSLGSALTYIRRYSLAAIIGVCPEDDDGEGAMGRKTDTIIDPPPPAPSKKDFFEVMEQERKRVGEVAYFAMLGTYGYEKATEITDPEQRKQVYKALQALHNKEVA